MKNKIKLGLFLFGAPLLFLVSLKISSLLVPFLVSTYPFLVASILGGIYAIVALIIPAFIYIIIVWVVYFNTKKTALFLSLFYITILIVFCGWSYFQYQQTITQYNMTAIRVGKQIQEKSENANSAKIEITGFDYSPLFDENNRVQRVNFRLKFKTNVKEQIYLTPQVNILAPHYLYPHGKPNRFSLSLQNMKMVNTQPNKEEVLEFFAQNELINNEYAAAGKGKFEIRPVFGVYVDHPYSWGQGNATGIENIIDLSGRGEKDQSENSLGLVYLSEEYLIK